MQMTWVSSSFTQKERQRLQSSLSGETFKSPQQHEARRIIEEVDLAEVFCVLIVKISEKRLREQSNVH